MVLEQMEVDVHEGRPQKGSDGNHREGRKQQGAGKSRELGYDQLAEPLSTSRKRQGHVPSLRPGRPFFSQRKHSGKTRDRNTHRQDFRGLLQQYSDRFLMGRKASAGACRAFHSSRKATRGSTRVARRAGMKQAKNATAARIIETETKVAGSFGVTSKSMDRKTRVTIAAPTRPAANPTTTIRMPSPSAKRRISRRCAPRATRIPTSCARWLKE